MIRDGETADFSRTGVFHKGSDDHLLPVAVCARASRALRPEFAAEPAGVEGGRLRVFLGVFRRVGRWIHSTDGRRSFGHSAKPNLFSRGFSLLQKDPHASDPTEASISEIQGALEKLIVDGQHAWSPYVSSWSLRALGTLSKKYNRFENRGLGNFFSEYSHFASTWRSIEPSHEFR